MVWILDQDGAGLNVVIFRQLANFALIYQRIQIFEYHTVTCYSSLTTSEEVVVKITVFVILILILPNPGPRTPVKVTKFCKRDELFCNSSNHQKIVRKNRNMERTHFRIKFSDIMIESLPATENKQPSAILIFR